MEVKSVAKNTGIPALKMRLLVNLVRGKRVEEALVILKYAPSPHAKIVGKVIKAAAADAQSVYQIAPSDLRVTSISADQAPRLKRYRAAARRRAHSITRNSSHVSVVVSDQEA